jgi:signal transduction histidine kinase/CheY-like chemotaxis protein/HPt (histidine-containing phosphotransfer) domain-containing protein
VPALVRHSFSEGGWLIYWGCEMIKTGRFIHLGGLKFSPTILTIVVIALSSAGIIALSLYSDSRADYLYANKDQIYILMNSWHHLEREMLSLLVGPVTNGDEEKWLYSLKTFDTRLRNFVNSPAARELAGENRLFRKKLSDINQLWARLRGKMERSAPQLTEYINANQSSTLQSFKDGVNKSALSCGGLLYRLGYLSGKDSYESDYNQLSQIVSNCRGILSTSQVYCTVLLEEMNNIISGQIAQQTVHLRLIVFILSMVIVISTVFFMVHKQRESHLYQLRLQQLVGQRTSELEAVKAASEAATIQAQQLNRQLHASVGHANLMTQQAMQADRSKGEFLADMSHEIRIPMNAIIGFSEMLAEENLTQQQKKQVGIIRDSSRQLLQLINDILDFSKIEAGKLDIEIADCSIESVLAAVESLMRPMTIEKGLQFEIIRNEPLPEFIRTDPARLKQCLISLVSSAIRFTDRGHVYVRIFWDNSSDKPFIRFDVEYTQSVLSPERQYRVFGGSGTAGLGLTITQRLAELLAGSVTISSATPASRGSVFTLIIPTGVPSAEAAQRVDTPVSAFPESTGNSRLSVQMIDNLRLSGRVLVAEDSPTNQALVELLLKKLGIEVVIVENGQQAVQKAMTEKFDVILMDIQMPVMNGYEATGQLRRDGIKIPIIALTAHAMKGDDEKCFAAGCSDYLPKPINRKKLVEILSKYLSVADLSAGGLSKADTNRSGGSADSKEKLVRQGGNDSVVKQHEVSGFLAGSDLSAQAPAKAEIEIDWQLLTERVGGEDLIDEIVPIFIKDNTDRMKMLSLAVEKNDAKEIKFYSHSLKGASATIGAAKISELARQLEVAARDSDNSNCRPLFQKLNIRFARLIDFLSKSNWKQIAQQVSSRQHTERS